MLEVKIFGGLKWNNFLAEHFDGLFLVNRNFFMFSLNSFVFDIEKVVLSFQYIIFLFESIDFFLMRFSDFIEFLIVWIKIFFVLILKSVNCLEKLYFKFSLDNKNLILKSFDMGFKSVLKGLIALYEFLISGNNELNLWIFGWKSIIKISNLIH